MTCSYGLLIVGSNNSTPSYGNMSLMLTGKNLNLYDEYNPILLGRNNRATEANELFIVGNGTDANSSENEVEILDDGTIRIGAYRNNPSEFALEIDSDDRVITIVRQGDIRMRIFQ